MSATTVITGRTTPTLAQWMMGNRSPGVIGPSQPPSFEPIAIVDGLQPFSTSPPGGAMTPAKIRGAYGIDQVVFGSVQGDGTGQTIALIDAYHYPTAFSDLNAFSTQFGLPTLAAYPSSSPWFRQVAQDGSTNYPSNSGSSGWSEEAALDIEWAHAVAPGANILLVEANSASNTSLIQRAVDWARNQPGVVAISMSFGGNESSGETSLDSYFTTPSGHAGVTFLASTGDSGKPGSYPAYSPNVVAVGGTTLNVSGNTWSGESGWSSSGGGISSYESQPVWQSGVVTQSTTQRTIPDVAMDANPSSGVAVYDSYDYAGSPWLTVGGTSLSSPMWAGLIAIIAQGRALAGLTSLDGATQTLPALYRLPAADFHDITSGNNGYAAGSGYDLVTGRGSPIALKLINDLIGTSISGHVFNDTNGNGVFDAGEPGLAGWTVYLDANGNGQFDSGETSQVTDPNGSYSFTAVAVGTYVVRIVQQAGYQLISPAGGSYSIPVQSGTAATGKDFANVQAGSIAGQVFTDTNDNGALDTGETGLAGWTVYLDANNNGQLDAGETSQVTPASGNYSFTGLPAGTYTVRLVPQTGYQTTTPSGGAYSVPVSSGTAATGKNFGIFQSGSISGQVFGDTNGNGALDTGETGLAGWTVYIDANGNSQLDPGETSQVTQAGGNYSFTGLSAGKYTVRIVPQTGYQTTIPYGGAYSVTIQSGTVVSGKNIGSYLSGSITGMVFVDMNGNGQLDRGDTGLASQTVYLDLNNNGILDNSERNTLRVTNSIGMYTYSGLATGTYTVRLKIWSQYQLTTPANGFYSVSVQAGAGTSGKNFGCFQLGSISGQVFNDANGNGQFDNGESGLNGCTVYLDGNNNGQLDAGETSLVTLPDGSYTFDGLSAGTYAIRVIQPSGYRGTSPTGGLYTVLIQSGTAAIAENFGERVSSGVPGTPALAPNSDTGISATDGITALNNSSVATALQFSVPQTIPGATVALYADGQLVGSAAATSTTTTITTDGLTLLTNGQHTFTATQTEPGKAESAASGGLALTIDASASSGTITPPQSNPVSGPVNSMQIVFTKAVYGFDLSHLTLSRDGFAVSLATAALNTTDNLNFSLDNLAGLTTLPGTYLLSATNTGVTDAAGNALASVPVQTWSNTLLTGTSGDDQAKIVRDPTDPTLADVCLNSATTSFQLRFGNLPLLQANLGDGNDTLTMDFINGNPLPAGGLNYDGGTGTNVLAVISPGGGNAMTARPGQFLFNTTPINLTSVDSVMPISADGKDTLTVAVGTSLKLATLPNKTLFMSELTIASTATVDLGDNSLVLAYGTSSPLAQLTQEIVNGRDGLAGAKLLTTATAARPSALGIVDNQMIHAPTWGGVQIDDGTHLQIIVKFTYVGDVNLDGQVTQDDLYNLIANQGGTGGWFNGDVNLDGSIDPADLALVLGNLDAGTGGANGSAL